MSVSYSLPLQRSVARAQRMLFTPFSLEKWLVLGFAAFLSEWLSGGWGRGGSGSGWRTGPHVRGPLMLPEDAVDRLRDVFAHLAAWLPLIVAFVCLALLVALLFQWLGARGKFVFLDGVVRERAAIREPWARYARQGQSLFVWKLVYWFLVLTLFVVALLPALGTIIAYIGGERGGFEIAGPVLFSGMLLLPLGLASSFVMVLLDDFVEPLMYRHDLTVNQAWRRFSPLLSREWPAFVLYALMLLVLFVIFAFLVVAIGIGTCCLGFLICGAPYIGQVFLLPVYVFFRSLGPEFLAQFGPEFDAFAGAAPVAPVVPAAPVAPATPTA